MQMLKHIIKEQFIMFLCSIMPHINIDLSIINCNDIKGSRILFSKNLNNGKQ